MDSLIIGFHSGRPPTIPPSSQTPYSMPRVPQCPFPTFIWEVICSFLPQPHIWSSGCLQYLIRQDFAAIRHTIISTWHPTKALSLIIWRNCIAKVNRIRCHSFSGKGEELSWLWMGPLSMTQLDSFP